MSYPRKIKVWLVVSTNAVINNLELLGGGDAETRHVLDSLAHCSHVLVLVFLQPGAFAYSVVCYLQLAGLVILDRGTSEL